MAYNRRMTDSRRGTTGGVSLQDLGFLLFLGAVWGGAFLFLRIAAPQIGPLWAAEIRIGRPFDESTTLCMHDVTVCAVRVW